MGKGERPKGAHGSDELVGSGVWVVAVCVWGVALFEGDRLRSPTGRLPAQAERTEGGRPAHRGALRGF